MRYFILCLCVFVLVGCQAPSMNAQRYGCRAAGDGAATFALDEVNIENVDLTKQEAKKVILDIKKFVEEGDISNLLTGELEQQLLNLVPDEYKFYVVQVMAVVKIQHVDTDKIGNDNKKRILAVLDGLLTGIDCYDKDDR